MKPISSIFRTAACAGLLVLASVWPLAAQEVVAPRSVEELFGKLVQLQEANLGVARQIAETQLRASDALQVVLDEGAVADDTLVKLTQTFIDNGRTLASIVLSPMALQNVSAGQSLQRLLRSNIVMLDRVRPQVRTNADLAAAFEKYTVLQAQTEDLIVAFDNGWDRYGEVVRTAVLAGMIRAGSFDAVNGIWTLGSPEIRTAEAAPEEDVTQPTVPTPVPALTGNPAPREQLPAQPAVETTPLVAPDVSVAATSSSSRLDATGPLALAEINVDGTGRIGDWTIASDGPDLFVASSPNIDAGTRNRIASLNIACGENGALYYQVVAAADYGSYAVYSDDSLTRAVRAESNIISGPEASAMADTLRLGYDWATRDPEKQRRLTVAAVDDDEIPAQFSPSGYMEARGKVLDACVAGIVAQAMGTATRSADSPQASPTASAADLPRGAVIKPGLVAPVPKARPSSFRKQGPVDIMAGT